MSSNWQLLKLGEVCAVRNGATPDTSIATYWDGPHAWVTPAEMGGLDSPYVSTTRRTLTDKGLAACSASLAPKKSVILSSRAPIGHLIINEVPMATNQGCKTLVARSGLNYKYLYYFLKASVPLLDSLGTGATFRELSAGKLKEVTIPVPPLAEQRRIVVKLDDVTKCVQEIERLVNNELLLAQELAGSILVQQLQSVDSGDEIRLGQIAVLKGRIGWRGLTAKEYTTEGPLFLSVHSLNYGHYVDTRDAFHVSQDRYDESPEIMLERGDILICKDGAGIGKLGMVAELPGPATINSSLLLIRPSRNVRSEYLYFYLLSPIFQRRVQERLSGSTTPHLYQRDIAELMIQLPSLEVQDRVLGETWDALETQEELVSIYRQCVAECSDLKQSVLEAAFRGEL